MSCRRRLIGWEVRDFAVDGRAYEAVGFEAVPVADTGSWLSTAAPVADAEDLRKRNIGLVRGWRLVKAMVRLHLWIDVEGST